MAKRVPYSIPFNGDLNLAEKALKTGNVAEVYFAGPKGEDASNYYPRRNQPEFSRKELNALTSLCKRYGAKTNLLCNSATLFFADFKKLKRSIRSLPDIDAITVADPAGISRFKQEFPDKDIQISIIMNPDSFCKVEAALELGAGTVNVSPELNRNIPLLRDLGKMKKTYPDFRIKLLANYNCAYDCIFMNCHYMLGSFISYLPDADRLRASSRIYRDDRCFQSYTEAAALIRRPFIRPEDTLFYEENNCVDIFKLVTRNCSSAQLEKIYRAYFERRFDGNLFDLVFATAARGGPRCDNTAFPPDFARVVSTCSKECAGCSYCRKVAKTVISRRPLPDKSPLRVSAPCAAGPVGSVPYSIPFNGDLKLAEDALKTGKVAEVYFAGPKGEDASSYHARKRDRAPGRRKISALTQLCRKYGAKTNLLCNPATLFFADIKKLLSDIRSLPDIDAVTVADPAAISVLKREFPDKDIQASIIMDLDSYCKVEQALKQGAGGVTVAAKLNRDISVLRSLKGLKKIYPDFRIRLIANYDCAYDCLFMNWHYMLGVFRAELPDAERLRALGGIYPGGSCLSPVQEASRFIRVPFIRPQDTLYYEKNDCVDAFKLIYRDNDSGKLRRIYRAYFGRKYDGNLFELLSAEHKYSAASGKGARCDNSAFPADFVETVTTCGKDCFRCSYCAGVADAVFSRRGSGKSSIPSR